jgi:hypothetical protein
VRAALLIPLLAAGCARGILAVPSAPIVTAAELTTLRRPAPGPEPDRAPCARRDPLRRPFFGDLHAHTGFSQDASTQGVRATPREAYRFARGDAPAMIPPYDAAGQPTRIVWLARPLDFAAVTDHAEQLGEVRICQSEDLEGHDSWVCWMYRHFPRLAFFVMNTKVTYVADPTRFGFCGAGGFRCRAAARERWGTIRAAAEEAYDRTAECRFTSFVGYEWTGNPLSRSLHRQVLFRSAAVPEEPTSYVEASSTAALWRALRADCFGAVPGCDAITVPHSPNLSMGLLFPNLATMPREEALARAFFEPVVEIMQHQGSSECRRGAGTDDELCAFELLPYGDLRGGFVRALASLPGAPSFVRNALGRGLAHEERTGLNPYRFGFVGGSDTHRGVPGAVDEAAFLGHGGAGAPDAARALPDAPEFNPGGLTVLWAEENTREALFAALLRREAYATSGTRPYLRVFGGWELPADLCARPDFAATGYAQGVPMGSVLAPRPPTAAAPALAVLAEADSGAPGVPGTPLQRIQVVKGWLEDGKLLERVIDVAGDAAGGATVDRATCSPRGAGFARLCTVWRDPEFDPRRPAWYYVRLLENPTCRWNALACNALGVRCDQPGSGGDDHDACCDGSTPWQIQERAWSSPIWYVPGGADRAPGA